LPQLSGGMRFIVRADEKADGVYGT